jgi:hypothetical protein
MKSDIIRFIRGGRGAPLFTTYLAKGENYHGK